MSIYLVRGSVIISPQPVVNIISPTPKILVYRSAITLLHTRNIISRMSSQFTCLNPVPSDIDISQATGESCSSLSCPYLSLLNFVLSLAVPLHISQIAESAGIRQDEYDLYGITKAKVADIDSVSFF